MQKFKQDYLDLNQLLLLLQKLQLEKLQFTVPYKKVQYDINISRIWKFCLTLTSLPSWRDVGIKMWETLKVIWSKIWGMGLDKNITYADMGEEDIKNFKNLIRIPIKFKLYFKIFYTS